MAGVCTYAPPKLPQSTLVSPHGAVDVDGGRMPAVIPPDLLLEPGRPARLPLRAWARRVLGELPPSARRPGGWAQLTACMNLAALIEVYRGSPARARELCERQLRWVSGLQRAHGVRATLPLAFAPCINLGRLSRIEGAPDEALARFALFAELGRLGAGREVCLGPMVVDASTWAALIGERPALSADAEALHVVESLKTLLAGRDDARTLQFVATCRAEGVSGEVPYLDEAEVIALARLGRHGEALAVTDREAFQRGTYTPLVARLHRAAVLAASGYTLRARDGVEDVFARTPAVDPADIPDQRVLRYVHQVGRMARHVGMEDRARRFFELGLAGSRGFGDEPLELSFLEALLALGAGNDGASLEAARERLLRECLNVTLLRPRGLSAHSSAADDPVFAELRGAIEALAG